MKYLQKASSSEKNRLLCCLSLPTRRCLMQIPLWERLWSWKVPSSHQKAEQNSNIITLVSIYNISSIKFISNWNNHFIYLTVWNSQHKCSKKGKNLSMLYRIISKSGSYSWISTKNEISRWSINKGQIKITWNITISNSLHNYFQIY